MPDPQPIQGSTAAASRWKIRQKDGVYIDGKRDSGKTVLIYYVCLELAKAGYNFDIWDVVGNLKPLARELQKLHKGRVVYTLVNPHDDEKVDALSRQVLQRGNTMLVLDEADRYGYYVGKKSPLSDIVNLGRNYNIGYMAATRRPAEIPKDFIANTDWSFIYRHLENNDVAALVANTGLPEQDIRGLADHEFLVAYHDRIVARAKLDAATAHRLAALYE